MKFQCTLFSIYSSVTLSTFALQLSDLWGLFNLGPQESTEL